MRPGAALGAGDVGGGANDTFDSVLSAPLDGSAAGGAWETGGSGPLDGAFADVGVGAVKLAPSPTLGDCDVTAPPDVKLSLPTLIGVSLAMVRTLVG